VVVRLRLRISPPRIKLAASNFARRFIGVLGKESSILGNFALPRNPKLDEYEPSLACRPRLTDVRATLYLLFSERAGQTPRQRCAVCEIARRVECGRRIGMCGYTAVPKDGRTC